MGSTDPAGDQLVLVERQAEQRTALVRLNRPKQLNALNGPFMDELCEALEELDRDEDVRAIVVTGNERAFAAGADIGEMADATPIDMLRGNRIAPVGSHPAHRQAGDRRRQRLVPGGGCELAMTLDLILAGEGAKFGQPEINIGVIPGAGGTQRLTRAIGKSRAMEMVLTGEPMGARRGGSSAAWSRAWSPTSWWWRMRLRWRRRSPPSPRWRCDWPRRRSMRPTRWA